ncbi:MAG: hypothetical protein ACYC4Q_03680 [Victivallaceae bacterium]
MKKLSLFLAGAMTVAGIFANAEETKNLIVNGNAADGTKNWQGVQKVADGGPDGAKCFEVSGSKLVTSQEPVPADTSGEYLLTGYLKSGNDKANQVYIGLRMLDKNKRFIDPTSVSPLAKSETELAADVKKGDTVIKVKDASTWETLSKAKRLTVAFDADDSGEYKDLPNYNYYNVKNLENKDGVWEATLVRPATADFPAGTKLRAHFACGHYMYVYAAKKNMADWTKITGSIKPVVKTDSPGGAFWPGTKYVQVLILANWGQKDGEVLQFSNVSLEKVEPKK